MNRVHIERDPNNKLKEQKLLQQMQSIIQQHSPQPVQKTDSASTIQTVDIEQAIRELLELEKNIT